MAGEFGTGRVAGKVALVTGTASGMGVTHAQLLAREGAKVIMTDVNEADGAPIAEQIGSNALFLRHDVADRKSWEDVVAAGVEHFGPITVLVNTNGMPSCPSASSKASDWALIRNSTAISL